MSLCRYQHQKNLSNSVIIYIQFAFKCLKWALTFEKTEIKTLIITFVMDFTCIDHLLLLTFLLFLVYSIEKLVLDKKQYFAWSVHLYLQTEWKRKSSLQVQRRFYRISNLRCSVEKGFLKMLENSQETTCARVSFLIKLY